MFNPTAWLPLFPLNSVLFPSGMLSLKVFEARYISMVRDCIEQGRPFGVVRMRPGQETGNSAEPETVGCLAHIHRSDMQDAGVLMLHAKGGERFRIRETRPLPDQRLEAQIDMIPADIASEVTPMQVKCAAALKAVIDDFNTKGHAREGDLFISPFAQPLRFDDAGWVANRWCEVLPIPQKARQKLLELEDAQSRLTIVGQYLQQHQIL